jgi:hypothetical protein
MEYNDVIANELSSVDNVVIGSDLFSCFLAPSTNRFSLFYDNIHLNGLGQQVLAHLLHDSFNGNSIPKGGPCPSPIFILEDITPYDYKQNLLELGDEVYVDETFTLMNHPFELSNGRWIMTAHADRSNSSTSFVSFDLGATSSTVYIAYQSGATPPNWLESGYQLSTPLLQVELDIAGVETVFNLYRKDNVTGTISLGGNMAAGANGAQYNYFVIVVEN